MTKKEQLKTIREAYDAIPDLQDGFFEVRERLFDMNLLAERRHRHGRPAQPLTVKDAAKLFTVQHLLDGHKQPDKWDTGAILHIRTEVLYAQAYAKKHHAELADWAGKWSAPFESVDYAKLMKVQS